MNITIWYSFILRIPRLFKYMALVQSRREAKKKAAQQPKKKAAPKKAAPKKASPMKKAAQKKNKL